jgi:hypothetical protein
MFNDGNGNQNDQNRKNHLEKSVYQSLIVTWTTIWYHYILVVVSTRVIRCASALLSIDIMLAALRNLDASSGVRNIPGIHPSHPS